MTDWETDSTKRTTTFRNLPRSKSLSIGTEVFVLGGAMSAVHAPRACLVLAVDQSFKDSEEYELFMK